MNAYNPAATNGVAGAPATSTPASTAPTLLTNRSSLPAAPSPAKASSKSSSRTPTTVPTQFSWASPSAPPYYNQHSRAHLSLACRHGYHRLRPRPSSSQVTQQGAVANGGPPSSILLQLQRPIPGITQSSLTVPHPTLPPSSSLRPAMELVSGSPCSAQPHAPHCLNYSRAHLKKLSANFLLMHPFATIVVTEVTS